VIRVLIADDHAVVRQGLRAFLELQEGIEVVGEAADGERAVAEAQRLLPDVALMDLVMPRLGGEGAIRRIAAVSPATRVIVLTSFADDDKLFPAVRAGAAGYLLKDVEPRELVRSIRAADAGETILHPAVAARLVEGVAGRPGAAPGRALTEREREVLGLIARGMANKRIALELGVAEPTVKTHVSNILGKLGLSDRTQAALWAVREGLVEPERLVPPD
jgi:two-component system, NarL family, response regulator LiaR